MVDSFGLRRLDISITGGIVFLTERGLSLNARLPLAAERKESCVELLTDWARALDRRRARSRGVLPCKLLDL